MPEPKRVGDTFKFVAYGGYDENGNQRKKKRTWKPSKELLRNKAELKKELQRQQVALQEQCDNESMSTGSIKFSAFVDLWFDRYANKNLKPTSIDFYNTALTRILPVLGNIKLENLNRRHVDNFYISLEEHGTQQNRTYLFTSDFKAYCKQNHIVRYKLAQQADISAEVLERLNKNQPISQKSYNKLINHLDKDLFKLANEDRKLAQNTLRHHHRVLNAILQKAVKWGYMDENPCSKVEPPREERKEAAYLDDIQIQSLLELLENEPEQYRMMIQLFIFSGMRRGEVCGLKWEDVNFAALCKMTEDDVIEEIGGELIFRNPTAGAFDEQWVAADEYLCGNVVQKLAEARAAAEHSNEYDANITALEAIQPPVIPSSDIQISLSSQFLKKEYIAQFIFEVIGDGLVGRDAESFGFSTTRKGAVKVHQRCYIPPNHPNFHSLYGTKDYSAIWIIQRLINKKQVVAMKDERDPKSGKMVRAKDVNETLVLEEKAATIESAFQNWIYADAVRETDIVSDYNMKHNTNVIPKYDGSHLSFPGMTATIDLKAHQKNAVYRIIRDNGALIGHVVGAGKTITLLAAGMELKRLGRISKPLYLVPNNLLAQWGGEMLRLYPTANILLAEPDDMRKHRRKRFLARLATGNYDAIILGSSSFGQIPAPSSVVRDTVHKTARKAFIKRFEGDDEKHLGANYREMITPRMEEDILKSYMSNQTADYTLEELGVDYLFVDEAHEFKNLYCGSARGQIRGVANTGSAKCTDLYYKTKYLSQLHGGKGGFTFATGTPIVNSIVELYSWQRYYHEELLIENGILSLDDWLALFGNVTSVWELPPEGLDEDGQGFRQVTRVSSFKNVPELMKMVLQFLDCVTRDEIDMETPDVIYKTVNCEPTAYQQDYMRSLVERANYIRKRAVKPEQDNMLKVTMDGRKSALDVRIVTPNAIDSKTSKVSECAANVLSIRSSRVSF